MDAARPPRPFGAPLLDEEGKNTEERK